MTTAKHIEQITLLRKLDASSPGGLVSMQAHIEEVKRGHDYAINWAREDARELLLQYINRLENDIYSSREDDLYSEYDNEFIFQKFGSAGLEGALIALQGVRDELLKGLF